jgi:AAA domain
VTSADSEPAPRSQNDSSLSRDVAAAHLLAKFTEIARDEAFPLQREAFADGRLAETIGNLRIALKQRVEHTRPPLIDHRIRGILSDAEIEALFGQAADDAVRERREYLLSNRDDSHFDLAEQAQQDTSNRWSAAQNIDAFLAAQEVEQQYLIPNILAREVVTIIVSPRGLGKTHLAYWWAILLACDGYRVLLIDRDNPKHEIRRRLKAWGGAGLADKIKIICRDEAPPLTDKAAWAAFPYADYDFVILDSISAATEGVEEKDGGKAGAGLAPLLDAARKGPAVLVLANTDKAGQ